MIRTVLVDDEPPACRKLLHLLSTEPDFQVIGQAASAAAAIETINRVNPDLVFLDIGLPDASGFEVVSALTTTANLQIVFVTAYDEFALKAFEVQALDYLLKPVEPSRFARALDRIRAEKNYPRRLLIQAGNHSLLLPVDQIDWIESARNYACIHVGPQTHIQRSTLDALAAKLDPKIFHRINRSEIVNARRIAELRPCSHGDTSLRLLDGTELTWSRRYRLPSLKPLEEI